jgi:16S rRNA (uracil1498-N3)-methyltransferase
MNRFFLLEGAISVQQTVDLSPLAHQLYTVLRLTAGAEILLLDGAGFEYPTRLQRVERSQASGLVLGQRRVGAEPTVAVTLYQCALKNDKFEWVLQKGTELGVTRFVPTLSERTVVRPAAALLKKYERWCAIVREAAEQCGRGRIPEIGAPLLWPQAVDAAVGLRLLPWEAVAGDTTAPGLGHCVTGQSVTGQNGAGGQGVSLAIGPEGGLAEGEVRAAEKMGWQIVALGRRILRAETAALAALTIIQERLGELGSPGGTNFEE